MADAQDSRRKRSDRNKATEPRNESVKALPTNEANALLSREIIKNAGKPLNLSEILSMLSKPDTAENKNSIRGSLGRYARESKIFVLTSANTFGLIELGHTRENQLVEVTESKMALRGDREPSLQSFQRDWTALRTPKRNEVQPRQVARSGWASNSKCPWGLTAMPKQTRFGFMDEMDLPPVR